MKIKRLPSSQLEVMQVIWNFKKPVTRNEIKEQLSNKGWAVTTFNTFLSRLVDNEFLTCRRLGKEYVYTAVINEDDYLEYEGKTIIGQLYRNSIKNFIAAICYNDKISDDAIEEIQSYLEQLKRENNDS